MKERTSLFTVFPKEYKWQRINIKVEDSIVICSVMSRYLYVVLCYLFLYSSGEYIDKRIILKLRNSIEKTINYIKNNYDRVNEDCLFGVVLSTAIMADSYRNGTHVMDSSTLKIIKLLTEVLKKSKPYIKEDREWISKSLLQPDIWIKNIQYKYNSLYPYSNIKDIKVLTKITEFQDDRIFLEIMDFCLKDLVNATQTLIPGLCFVNTNCWNYIYNRSDETTSGYLLTHKLLLFQLGESRKCLVDHFIYQKNIKYICSNIYLEVINGDYFDVLDRMFDLFMEEVMLCGYEGYADFLTNKWLLYILKSQRTSGCFPPILSDDLKTKIKRTTNIFEDGCADHTTGIGLAVLSLYYNFIIKEIFIEN